MTPLRIALIGGDDDFGAMLMRLLRECDYEVDRYAEDAVDIRETDRFREYDFVVASDALADRGDDAVFVSFVLAARRFLFYEASRTSGHAPDLPAPYLVRSMSPEDIVFTVNDAVWQGVSVSGRPSRSTPRIKADIEVIYECGSETRSSRIASISENGVFIRTVSPPPRGTPVRLFFTLPGGGARIDAAGRVVHAIECDIEKGIILRPGAGARKIVAFPGIGIVFEEIAEDGRSALRAFVEKRLVPA